ncbi:MAG: hypothetical protein AB7N99_03350 [Simkaniaceae bacterium]|jgi:hypothetical protein
MSAEDKLLLQEANRLAMEQRYPNLIYSKETMDQKRQELELQREKFLRENEANIKMLPLEMRNIIYDTGIIALGAISVATTNGIVFLTGVGIVSLQLARLQGDYDKIKIIWEDLEKNNSDYFSIVQQYNEMVEANTSASFKKCEQEGYKPELHWVEKPPEHLLDFSQWFVDVKAGPDGGPAFQVGYNWSF